MSGGIFKNQFFCVKSLRTPACAREYETPSLFTPNWKRPESQGFVFLKPSRVPRNTQYGLTEDSGHLSVWLRVTLIQLEYVDRTLHMRVSINRSWAGGAPDSLASTIS